MATLHTNSVPRLLPFDAGSLGWEHFERFCAAWFVSGTSLPTFNLSEIGPSRLRILDAVRYGTVGAKQRGIDILATMENRATWVVQCKHTPKFTRGDVEKAIQKAESEYGSRQPARWLLWVTGSVSPDALEFVREKHPNWTLWDGERLSQEFLLHTPRRQAFQIIESVFGAEWAKAFFPLPDSLLITAEEFFARWAGEERLFHHRTTFVGRQSLMDRVTAFGSGGKGSKALILSAAGGIGKTRLLRAVAERIETEAPDRVVRFTNPEAPHAEPPRYEDAATLTVLQDDAHRLDTIPPLLLGVMAKEVASGARLILATRPGAEDALRELLMRSGWQSQHIETVKVGKLTRPEMEQLAAACLGDTHPDAARPLAQLSDGCALITLVGAELLRRGELTHLDLVRSDHFRTEVFRRFEGQELDRVRGSLERPLVEKLLRSIALLSPWPGSDSTTAQTMADFLGIQRGQVDAACDSLISGGLFVRTRDGYRITPDLFSDHLAYAACYDAAGQSTAFIRPFLDRFAEEHSQTVLKNLAEAEWRALQQHGSGATSVVAPVWHRFLDEFSRASFWQRSAMLGRWADFAFYQPARSLELAGWAMDLTTAPPDHHVGEFDNQSVMLEKIPALLISVAIWSDAHRHQALDLLWRLRRDFPWSDRNNENSGYSSFAAIAAFKHNFPDAANGVLDWLERLLAGPDAALSADRPSGFIKTIFQPYFVRCIERNYMRDRHTFVFGNVPISVSRTKAVRQLAFRILTEQIIPRGTAAAINGLPALGDAFHQPAWLCELSAAETKAWLPEQRQALQAIRDTAAHHNHPLVNLSVRRLLDWQVVYGKDAEFLKSCGEILATLTDNFEFKLARFTLSWCGDDFLERNDSASTSEWLDKAKSSWDALGQEVCSLLLQKHPNELAIHDFLTRWVDMCAVHGLTPRMNSLLYELTQQNQPLANAVLDHILKTPGSTLAADASSLLGSGDQIEVLEPFVLRGLASADSVIVRCFLNAIHWQPRLRTEKVRTAVFSLISGATDSMLESLMGLIRYPAVTPWVDELILSILQRGISDAEMERLTEAVHEWVRSENGTLAPAVAVGLINRLTASSKIKTQYHQSGFLYDIAQRHPRLLFEMFLRRIERQVALRRTGESGFEAIPFSERFSLKGIEAEPDFEQISRDLLQRIRTSEPSDLWIWGKLFAMTVAMTSPLLVTLLTEWLAEIQSEDELADLAELTGFEGSLVIYSYPQLTEAILQRARAFGPKALERISWKLIHRAGPQFRSYTGSELNPEHRYLREAAEEAVRAHEGNSVLAPFFQKALEREIKDTDWMRRMDAEDDAAEW